MAWLCAIEVNFVSVHKRLKFECILRCHELGIREIVVQVVVNVRLMEPVRRCHRLASEISTVLLRQASLIVAEVVDVVHIALLFQLTHTSLCVAPWLWSINGYLTVATAEVYPVSTIPIQF